MAKRLAGPEVQSPAAPRTKIGVPIFEIAQFRLLWRILPHFALFSTDHTTTPRFDRSGRRGDGPYIIPMHNLIFDCDGVLVDSEHLSCGAWVPVLARYGITTDRAEIETMIGKSDQAVLEHFTRKTGTEFPAEILAERQNEYFRQAQEDLQTFPGLAEVLTTLGQRAIPRAVASSGHPDKIRFSLDRVGLAPHFDILCSAVEVSAGKPAPDLFLLAAQRLGADPATCAVIEDSIFGIEAALRAGMLAIGFSSSHPADALYEAGAHKVFGTYDEFLDLLGEL